MRLGVQQKLELFLDINIFTETRTDLRHIPVDLCESIIIGKLDNDRDGSVEHLMYLLHMKDNQRNGASNSEGAEFQNNY